MVIGTSRSGLLQSDLGNVRVCRASCPEDFVRVLTSVEPGVVVNLLRDETEEGLDVHRAVIRWCSSSSALYCYASSALALDGYSGCPLTEDLPAKSVSTYGRFKQSCETAMREEVRCRSLILRFASIHGWVPHSVTRSEAFLRKLARNEHVVVDRGVIQNRLFDRDLAVVIVELLEGQITGVVHLGARDSSEEYAFLRGVAVAFDRDPGLVLSGPSRNVDLVVVPSRVMFLLGAWHVPPESRVLDGLLSCAALWPYMGPRAALTRRPDTAG